MYQNWGSLLFLHWAIPPAIVRPLVPADLEIDTFAEEAWITVAPFTMWGIRSSLLPPLPLLSRSHELNVRTYVHHRGVPGVWFLSLDASSLAAVWGGRLGFHLPYFHAEMTLQTRGDTVRFSSRRTHRAARAASLEVEWTMTEALPEAAPGSLEFFLTERYALYAARGDDLLRTRIHHRPWSLRDARVGQLESTMLEAHGITTPVGEPVLQAAAEPLHVGVWRPEQV
jgi:uncharacterized protein YqjF (DUF2071 family)